MLEYIKQKFIENYDLGQLVDTEINNVGWSTNYVFKTTTGKYFVKILSFNDENNNCLDEIKICNFLREKGYPVSNFFQNRQGNYISELNKMLAFHVQEFVEGDIWNKNTAPSWLLEQGSYFIAKIHKELKYMNLGIRSSIDTINDKNKHVNRIDEILNGFKQREVNEDNKFFIYELERRRDIILNSELIDMSKLTFVNGHSDYSITQLITSDRRIIGIIDMTEVSRVPAIWELLRFYLNSTTEANEENIGVNSLKKFLDIYMNICSLSSYDLEMMHQLNYLYMCQAVTVFEKIIQTNDDKFVGRAKLRINKLKRFENYDDDIKYVTQELSQKSNFLKV
jgi:hypothetical protein